MNFNGSTPFMMWENILPLDDNFTHHISFWYELNELNVKSAFFTSEASAVLSLSQTEKELWISICKNIYQTTIVL